MLTADEQRAWQDLVIQLRKSDEAAPRLRPRRSWRRVAWAVVEAMACVSYKPAYLAFVEAD
jgi:hypothetical protein